MKQEKKLLKQGMKRLFTGTYAQKKWPSISDDHSLFLVYYLTVPVSHHL